MSATWVCVPTGFCFIMNLEDGVRSDNKAECVEQDENTLNTILRIRTTRVGQLVL